MLYVAGSIQPRALDSKLPLSAVFPLFSLSPQASPRCYLPIVPPSRSYSLGLAPPPPSSSSSSSSFSSSSAASASSRPLRCGSATRSRYNFPNDYHDSRVPAIGATSSEQYRETRATRAVGGYRRRRTGLRIHFSNLPTTLRYCLFLLLYLSVSNEFAVQREKERWNRKRTYRAKGERKWKSGRV